MTAPAELVEVQVPAVQVRVGDVLVINDENDEPAESPPVQEVILDAVPDFVYAFTPDQHPLRRDSLVRVKRPAEQVGPPAPAVIDPAEYEAVRDLALALADLQPPTGKAAAPVRDAAERVRKAPKP